MEAKWQTDSRFEWKVLTGLGMAALMILVIVPNTQSGQRAAATSLLSAPNLGTAANFGVLAGSAVTNTGPSVVDGNLGVSPGIAVTGFPPGAVTGAIHKSDGVALKAKSDLASAYNAIAGDSCSSNLTGQNLGGLTLTPGVYCFSSSALLTGKLTLNAHGDSNALFIFKVGSALTTASSSSVIMTNDGSACNVFWQVGSSAVLGAHTAFNGSILALASITLSTGTSLTGGALARNGAVTLDTNQVGAYPTSADIRGASCTMKNLESQVRNLGQVFTEQQEINFAAASEQYQATAAAFTTSVPYGATDIWSYTSNFKVSWSSAIVTFAAQAANGSEYKLVVSQNLKLDVIYSVSVIPFANAQGLTPTCNQYNSQSQLECNWSGYAVAGDSVADQQVYQAEAYWYVATPYAPTSGQSCTFAQRCEISQWAGLTDANGASIIQAGTDSYLYPSGCSSACYYSWLAIFNDPHSFGDSCSTTASGDEMYADIQNQYSYDYSTGSNYYLFLNDFTQSWLCTPVPQGGNPVPASFTPYYAAFEAERENPTATVLPSFNSLNFYTCGFNIGSGAIGVWNYYDAGDGFGTSMISGGYEQSYPGAMSHNSGTYFGDFSVNYLTSYGTPSQA